MKILNPYRFARGKGGSKPDWPALVPPDTQNLRKSMSMSQIVDILCEGPIFGLVDNFGKKVYGLDMLKGIYLNGTPIMNNKGEYNYRNILMEINLGTENQKSLPSFDNVFVHKPANFKLLGPIKSAVQPGEELSNPNGGEKRNFVQWAKTMGDWPSIDQDPFIFVHKIKNRDVKKIKVSLLVEQLQDTIDQGTGPGKQGKIGMSKSSQVELWLRWGLENSTRVLGRSVIIAGTALSPFAHMIGEGNDTVNANSLVTNNPIVGSTVVVMTNTTSTADSDSRNPSAYASAKFAADTLPTLSI